MAEALDKLYQIRFDSDKHLAEKNRIWKVLCKYLQRFVPKDGTVVDIAAGYCEFINNITATKKYAIDLNPDSPAFAAKDVEFISANIFQVDTLVPNGCADAVFISNLFEHLESRDQVLQLLGSAKRLLKPSGKVIILQPNIKHVGDAYWDFFDHKLPVSDTSLIEAAGLCDLDVDFKISRFLPYTTKSQIPKHPALVWLYLQTLPLSGYLLGSQSLLVFKHHVK